MDGRDGFPKGREGRKEGKGRRETLKRGRGIKNSCCDILLTCLSVTRK